MGIFAAAALATLAASTAFSGPVAAWCEDGWLIAMDAQGERIATELTDVHGYEPTAVDVLQDGRVAVLLDGQAGGAEVRTFALPELTPLGSTRFSEPILLDLRWDQIELAPDADLAFVVADSLLIDVDLSGRYASVMDHVSKFEAHVEGLTASLERLRETNEPQNVRWTSIDLLEAFSSDRIAIRSAARNFDGGFGESFLRFRDPASGEFTLRFIGGRRVLAGGPQGPTTVIGDGWVAVYPDDPEAEPTGLLKERRPSAYAVFFDPEVRAALVLTTANSEHEWWHLSPDGHSVQLDDEALPKRSSPSYGAGVWDERLQAALLQVGTRLMAWRVEEGRIVEHDLGPMNPVGEIGYVGRERR